MLCACFCDRSISLSQLLFHVRFEGLSAIAQLLSVGAQRLLIAQFAVNVGGSGMTAAVVGLALHEAGHTAGFSIYEGYVRHPRSCYFRFNSLQGFTKNNTLIVDRGRSGAGLKIHRCGRQMT